jgi:RHH-type proline utilization regulon transcriptional repressor/proline dehydrogenase/delta 1-pyrroline-5-carboxylate dehydrogenase
MLDLADESVALVRRWLKASKDTPADPSAERLAGLLRDPRGLEFAIGFVDTVVRPEDLRVAGRNLERLSHAIPRFLPWYLRAAIRIGGFLAPVFPWPVVPIARSVLRRMVGHLIIDATPKRLGRALQKRKSRGIRLNINLLGEAVLGDGEALRRLDGTKDLLQRPDVDYVSIKVSNVASQLSMWAFDDMVETVVARLAPLYEYAAASATTKFINLDMEEYRDLDLTMAVFRRLLERPGLEELEAGIVLQAYLPDAVRALDELTEWAIRRRAAGGAGIKIRVVKGANLAMEHVDSIVHDWPLATYGTKVESDTNYKRVLSRAFAPERTDAVRIGVAGHNLFDIAYAFLLAKQRHVDHRIDFEMLLGMATGQADAVRKDVGGLLLYTPVVHPDEFDSAISYLIRRLEENASQENFMSAVFELDEPRYFDREERRFRESLAALDDIVPEPNRRALALRRGDGFENQPDTDPSVAVNREWGLRMLERSEHSRLGYGTLDVSKVTDPADLEQRIRRTADAGTAWGGLPGETRARILHDAGDVLAAFRGRLVEVMASEAGKTIAEADVEVSEAIDFAHYYAERALDLGGIDGATFVPPRLTVVTPPWNFPVAIPAGSVLAALAAGSGVIIKPAHLSRRTAAVMVEALWEGGVPRDVLQFVDIEERALGQSLIAHPAVDRVILTGAWETAALFRSWRPDLPLVAETSGKNAIIVTPNADLDLAVADVVRSAFGHAGQKCSAASLVILVGSVAESDRFRRQLEDAVRTLRVGPPQEASSQMGPLIEPANGKLLDALTNLQLGETWLVKPRQLDETGMLWSPGVKEHVLPGSPFHLTEYFGPVLGIMTAPTLDAAIDLQNAVPYGLTAGIQSLDPVEVEHWIRRVQAGNLYVNRGITGAIVRRQPFGGWKRSSVGPSAKAGGPNYVMSLGSWRPAENAPRENLLLEGLSDAVTSVVTLGQPGMEFEEFDRVRRAARSDQEAWEAEFGVSRDVSGLEVERNVFRYRPTGVTIRLSEGESLGHLVRLLAAAARTGAIVAVSTALPLPTPLLQSFTGFAPLVAVRSVAVESDARWLARAAAGEVRGRVRLVGGDAVAFAGAVRGDPDTAIWAAPVTTAGRVELLPFLREQSVTITAHRFGNPDRGMLSVAV